MKEKQNDRPLRAEDKYSMKEITDLAFSTQTVLNNFRREVKNSLFRKRFGTEWLNSRQASRILTITQRTLKRYRRINKIQYKVMNGKCVYRYADVMALIKDPDEE